MGFLTSCLQQMNQVVVRVGEWAQPITYTSKQHLRQLENMPFRRGPAKLVQQNPNKTSVWARLAREGHQVYQLMDQRTNRYIGRAVDGKYVPYRPKKGGDR
jgi:hypothetical protein